jgi:ATP-binding cassette subfamily B (MDR/TAP) protein 1
LETAANDMTLNLKRKWFEAVVRQDMAYFDLQDVSGTATIISTNGAKYKKGVSKKLGAGVQFGCTVVAGFALAFYASWKVTLAVMGCVPIMAFATGMVLKINQSKTSRDNAAYSRAGAIVYQVAANIRTILALNACDEMIESFEAATEKAYDGAISQLVFLGIANGGLMSSFMLGYVVVVGFGSFLLYDAVRETGCDPSGAISGNTACDPAGADIFLALMGVIFGGATIPQISAAMEAIVGSRAACFPALLAISRKSASGDEQLDVENTERSEKLQSRSTAKALPKYAIDVSSNLGLKPKKVTGTIEFKDVTFSYPTRQEVQVFNGFSLTVEAGKTVALVGPSGSGKSTSIQLIERFYDPDFGTVTLDGHDMRELNVSWLRKHVGLVSQEPSLFATTIKENIRIAKPDATDKEVEEAARRANAHDFISSLQLGYETHVGDKGAQLSGGQKQRIAIARTLITNPKIILLDEATSALDSESEAIVQEALDVIMSKGDCTVIVIAHRLSTIKNADMIAVVKGGKVAETGTHAELLAKEGAYYELVEAQKGKVTRSESSASLATTATDTSGSNPPSRSNSERDLTDMEIDLTEEKSGGMSVPEEQKGDNSNAVIDLQNIHFTYPSRADNKIFHGLGFDVNQGETVAIVGPSGKKHQTFSFDNAVMRNSNPLYPLFASFPRSRQVNYHSID